MLGVEKDLFRIWDFGFRISLSGVRGQGLGVSGLKADTLGDVTPSHSITVEQELTAAGVYFAFAVLVLEIEKRIAVRSQQASCSSVSHSTHVFS